MPQNDRSYQNQPPRPAAGRPANRQGGYRQPAGASAGAGARQEEQRSASQGGRTPPRRQRSQSRWFRAIIMVLATIVGCLFLTIFILQSATDLFGLEQEDRNVTVEIPRNATIKEVAGILKDAGIVDRGFTFRMYAGLKENDGDFIGGEYVFNSNMGYDEIIVALKNGNRVLEEKRLMFTEGMTVREIALQLEEENICDAQEFLDFLETAEFDYDFMNMIPNDPFRYRRLEGYIFPDTYDFYVDESVSDVTRKFLRNFNSKMTEELEAQMLEMNMTMDETIILASIIQREAATEEDMAKVSSAFHNRLQAPNVYPNLQSDVTILYVENNIKPFLQQTNQAMYDAYNTYVCEGLPVGAICNPGMDAIRAALYPADTNYFFFVTDKNQEFYYAETAEEHYRNVRTAQSVGGNVHGIDTMDE